MWVRITTVAKGGKVLIVVKKKRKALFLYRQRGVTKILSTLHLQLWVWVTKVAKRWVLWGVVKRRKEKLYFCLWYLIRIQFLFVFCRSPVEMSCVRVDTVTASALLNSMLSATPRSYGWTLEGKFTSSFFCELLYGSATRISLSGAWFNVHQCPYNEEFTFALKFLKDCAM